MTPFSRRNASWLVLPLLVVFALASAACASGADDVPPTAAVPSDAPDWITKIYPAPGAETTATRAVQVQYETLPPGSEIRLIIDGTDVTSYAQQGTGLLEYDVDQDMAPVELEPGTHEATVELYTVQPGASEGADSFSASERAVIDSYSWSFELS